MAAQQCLCYLNVDVKVEPMPVTNLTNDQLSRLMAEDPALQLVDVRTPEEWQFLGHIPQAKLISLHELLARQTELDKAQKIVFVCEHGIRSADASHYFHHQLGYPQIYNLTHGMASWEGPRTVPSNAGHICATTVSEIDLTH